MNTILHSSSSVVHLVAALIAVGTGTYILFTPKGTTIHRVVGWVYTISMVTLLITAFQMYYLVGSFGIVHWGAGGSVIALGIGLGPIGLRTLSRLWLRWHYIGMGASITGLYAAFAVESTYRFFSPAYYWWVTLGFATVIFAIGGLLLYRHYPSRTKLMTPSSGRMVFRGSDRIANSAD